MIDGGVDVNGITTTVTPVATPIDTDGDSVPNYRDLDSDNDGIPDLVEENGDVTRDTDGDGVIDSLDLDSDNDGILDIVEAGGIDKDKNGRVDSATDSDHDGLANVVDRLPNHTDVPTTFTDALTMTILPVFDTDGDKMKDFQDVDSDNDGISDLVEGGTDVQLDGDNDGMIDGDVNRDGIADVISTDNGGIQATIPDTDNDGLPNYRDLDSENDKIKDVIEGGSEDNDNNGEVDTAGMLVDGRDLPDSNADGIPDYLEFYIATVADKKEGLLGQPISVNVLENDFMVNLNVVSIQIKGTDAPNEPLIVKGEGVWMIGENGEITFTPEEGFVYDPTPIYYIVEDDQGNKTVPMEVDVYYGLKTRDDKVVSNLKEPVTIDILHDDNGDLNNSSVQLVLPQSFKDRYPFVKLSTDKKSVVVLGEGIWNVDINGMVTFTPENGFDGQPTSTAYIVFNQEGKQSEMAMIIIEKPVVAGVVIMAETPEPICEDYSSNSVPSLNKVGLLLLVLINGLMGLFMTRKENAKDSLK
jgi:hypothetical protein